VRVCPLSELPKANLFTLGRSLLEKKHGLIRC